MLMRKSIIRLGKTKAGDPMLEGDGRPPGDEQPLAPKPVDEQHLPRLVSAKQEEKDLIDKIKGYPPVADYALFERLPIGGARLACRLRRLVPLRLGHHPQPSARQPPNHLLELDSCLQHPRS